MTETEFKPFPKIARLAREIIVTEKIDGTNASIHIGDDGSFRTASRTRWITPGDDNYGFALWAEQNREELMQLGPGSHFGEWWGMGIQRKYGLQERRFSLFNTSRWTAVTPPPGCCHVVPVLYTGPFDTSKIEDQIAQLRWAGSQAAPGFMRPEGVVVYHPQGNVLFKKTIEKDEEPKSLHQ